MFSYFPAPKISLLALGLFVMPASLVAVTLTSAPAQAQSANAKALVDAGKAAGTVGEQADGYLGLVGGADSATAAAVQEINSGRRKAFADIAAKSGVTPDAAGEAAAKQLIAKMPAGQFYKSWGGSWAKK